jgi:hypothetical protein
MATSVGGTEMGHSTDGPEGYDEEQVMGGGYDGDQGDVQKGGKEMYNEEEYLAEVGELNCYCVPSRVYGFKDFIFRTLAWFLLNKEQILGGFTGEYLY